jgi:hypothetical protein
MTVSIKSKIELVDVRSGDAVIVRWYRDTGEHADYYGPDSTRTVCKYEQVTLFRATDQDGLHVRLKPGAKVTVHTAGRKLEVGKL